MLSEKPWNREVLLLMLSGLLVSWCLGNLLGLMLPNPFFRFVINTLCLEAAIVAMVHLFLKLHGTSWKQFLGLTGPGLGRAILFAIVVAALVLPVVLALNGWLVSLCTAWTRKAAPEEPAIRILKSTVGAGQQIYFGVAAICLAPVAEESLFRGILYPFLKQQFNPRLALWATSLLFGAIHLNVIVFVPLTLLAMVLVFVYEKTDRLIAPILTHAVFNAVNFFMSVFEPELSRWLHHLSR